MRYLRSRLPALATFLTITSVGLAETPGRITGLLRCPGGFNPAVWAVSGDCRRSYRTVEFWQNRFVFESIPQGTYRLVGYCDDAYSNPSREFRVEPASTAEMDVTVSNPAGDTGAERFPQGIAPLNGRITDEGGGPIADVRVHGEFHPYSFMQGGADAVSGSDGRFGYCAVRVSFGTLTLTVTHPDYRTRKLRLRLSPFNYSDGRLEIRLRKKSDKSKAPKPGNGEPLR